MLAAVGGAWGVVDWLGEADGWRRWVSGVSRLVGSRAGRPRRRARRAVLSLSPGVCARQARILRMLAVISSSAMKTDWAAIPDTAPGGAGRGLRGLGPLA